MDKAFCSHPSCAGYDPALEMWIKPNLIEK